jgi:hypothetical protein
MSPNTCHPCPRSIQGEGGPQGRMRGRTSETTVGLPGRSGGPPDPDGPRASRPSHRTTSRSVFTREAGRPSASRAAPKSETVRFFRPSTDLGDRHGRPGIRVGPNSFAILGSSRGMQPGPWGEDACRGPATGGAGRSIDGFRIVKERRSTSSTVPRGGREISGIARHFAIPSRVAAMPRRVDSTRRRVRGARGERRVINGGSHGREPASRGGGGHDHPPVVPEEIAR